MIQLCRAVSNEYGTFGALVIDGKPVCVTYELPWKNNKEAESCIPTGKYKVVPHSSEKYQNVWRLENVPGREGILIHVGNFMADTTGCILPGESFSPDKPGVLKSLITIQMLRKILPPTFEIEAR